MPFAIQLQNPACVGPYPFMRREMTIPVEEQSFGCVCWLSKCACSPGDSLTERFFRIPVEHVGKASKGGFMFSCSGTGRCSVKDVIGNSIQHRIVCCICSGETHAFEPW